MGHPSFAQKQAAGILPRPSVRKAAPPVADRRSAPYATKGGRDGSFPAGGRRAAEKAAARVRSFSRKNDASFHPFRFFLAILYHIPAAPSRGACTKGRSMLSYILQRDDCIFALDVLYYRHEIILRKRWYYGTIT